MFIALQYIFRPVYSKPPHRMIDAAAVYYGFGGRFVNRPYDGIPFLFRAARRRLF